MSEKAGRILSSLAEAIRDEILDDLGRGNVLAVFLAGSVASGRTAALEKDGLLEIFSDLDLYVVVSDECNLESAGARAGIVSNRVELQGAGYRMFRRPEIGVYTLSTLLSQPARPGTVELSRNRRMLHGEGSILGRLPVFAPSAIARDEALYLLENRVLEMLELDAASRRGDEAFRRFLHYNALKCEADALSALLINEGKYDPVPEKRLEMLREGMIDVPDALAEPIERAMVSLADLSRAIEEKQGDNAAELGRAADVLLAAWLRIASRIYGRQNAGSWRRLVAARCRGRGPASNLRLARIICRKAGIGFGDCSKLWFRFPAFNPLVSLRTAGMCEMKHRRDAVPIDEAFAPGMPEYLDRLCRMFGVVGDGMFERACSLYRRLS